MTADERGYALVLAMLALVALTLLGIAALSIADVDLTITHNIRKYHQAFNAANAGLDQARGVTYEDTWNPSEIATLNAAAAQGDCTRIIDGTTDPAATAMHTGGWPAAAYVVDRCFAECGGVPRGYEMAGGVNQGGGGGQIRNVYLDTQSTGTDEDVSRTRSPATATTAGYLRILGYCY
jgi:hypothetical protein